MSDLDGVVILADAAAPDPSGKIHMLGAGWSTTGSPTAPAAVVVLLQIPWDRTNERLPCELTLTDADGRVVELPGGPIVVRQHLEVGRAPGLTPGTAIDASFHVNLAPMPLPAGRYTWRLSVADLVVTRSFEVRVRT